ncbi:MAG: DUF4381 domain-containing protein [Myxococcales bacterium]|nr:DUF4381 domain-containing protein [Myxococcales bacterium]
MAPNAQALAGLRDIHLPEAVSIWPLAPGWWLLAAAVVALGLLALLERKRRRTSVRRAALRELDEIAREAQEGIDTALLARRLQALLRRLALVRIGRVEVARLHGESWFEILAGPRGRRAPAFPVDLACRLEEAVYAGPTTNSEAGEGEAWIAAARRFVRSER